MARLAGRARSASRRLTSSGCRPNGRRRTSCVVNSEWSKDALIAQGVPAAKLLTVPVAYEVVGIAPVRRDRAPRQDRAADRAVARDGQPAQGHPVPRGRGPAAPAHEHPLRRGRVRSKSPPPPWPARRPTCRSWAGSRATRPTTYYRQADVFVLPTISDGFAITQVEAMARGLPVIITPNCGQVVTPGIDGLVVPAGDARALAEAIAKLDADRELLHEMSRQALVKARTFRLPRQAAQIESALRAYRQGLSPAGRAVAQEASA